VRALHSIACPHAPMCRRIRRGAGALQAERWPCPCFLPYPGAAQARSRRSVAGKDIMLDPRAGIRRAGALPPLLALLREVVEARPCRR